MFGLVFDQLNLTAMNKEHLFSEVKEIESEMLKDLLWRTDECRFYLCGRFLIRRWKVKVYQTNIHHHDHGR